MTHGETARHINHLYNKLCQLQATSRAERHEQVLFFIFFTCSQPFNEMLTFNGETHCCNSTPTDIVLDIAVSRE